MINGFISKTNIKEYVCIIDVYFELEKKFFEVLFYAFSVESIGVAQVG